MYIARLSLITLFAFTFVIGCGMVGQQTEMAEETAMSTTGEKSMSETSVSTPKKATYQEVTFNVEGMT